MARKPTNNSGQSPPETLSEMLFYLADRDKHLELDKHRLQFEAAHGPTDLTLRYTSTWPQWQQDWLLEHDPKSWFDGLPPFAKSYMRLKMEAAARKGKLDDMPDNFLQLYASGGMKLDYEEPSP